MSERTLPVKSAPSLVRSLAASPIVWGGLAAAGFYGLIEAGTLKGDLLDRYFLSHPVEYVATVLFFVGLAVLALKAIDLMRQATLVGRPLLGPPPPKGEQPTGCDVLLARLDDLPAARQDDHLVRRLRESLKFVRARQSAAALDEQMAVLAEQDAVEAEETFGLYDLIVKSIPVLGFLGTVIGITQALANLAPEQLEQSLPQVMAGLYVAFDTTALALGLTIVLMFVRYFVGRGQRSLLAQVDRHVATELEDRFIVEQAGHGDARDDIRRLAQRVFDNVDRLVERQAQLWHESIDAAGKRWSQMARAAGDQVRESVQTALVESLRHHARELLAGQQAATEENRRHWNEVAQTQVRATHAMASLQASLTNQAEVLHRAVEATGKVATLEEALNRNLEQLRGSKHFEQTAVSLAAAVQLLAARLGDEDLTERVRLTSDAPENQAA